MVYAYKVTRKDDSTHKTGIALLSVNEKTLKEDPSALPNAEDDLRTRYENVERIGEFDALAGVGHIDSIALPKSIAEKLVEHLKSHISEEGLPEGVPVGAVAGNA